MDRRRFVALSTLSLSSVTGCLNSGGRGGTTPSPSETASPTETGEGQRASGIEFARQESGQSTMTRERIVITNRSSDSWNIGGYTLAYSSGHKYNFSDLTLEPGADVAVVSRGVGDSVAESDPPTYYRNADLPELVLEDGSETMRLLDTDDEVVVEATYEG